MGQIEKASSTEAQTLENTVSCCKDVPNSKYSNNFHKIRRVGTIFQQSVTSYDVEGNPHQEWLTINRETAKDLIGKDNIPNTPYYSGFCIVPSHTNYKEVIGNQINLYHPLPCQPNAGEHPFTDILINRVFGNDAGKLWDYLTILYRHPLHPLPVLCLVSKENHSGKSTVGNLIKDLLGENIGFYGQDDLNSTFNVWIKSLVAIFEEISDTKRALNKIKAASTAQSITLNQKYLPQISYRPFVKVIILSNNEESFIQANEYDIRYWIVRVPPMTKQDFIPDFDSKLRSEAQAVLYTLSTRDIITPCSSRMWFAPEDIATDALEVVRQESRSECAKDILIWAEEVGENFYATLAEIREGIGNRYTLADIKKALQKELKLTNPQRRYKDRWGNERNGKPYRFLCGEDLPEQLE